MRRVHFFPSRAGVDPGIMYVLDTAYARLFSRVF